MLEKKNNLKQYVKAHKLEIGLVIAGTAISILGINCYKTHNRLIKAENEIDTVKEIAKASLKRELARNNSEIKIIDRSIKKLNNSNINVFERIPKKLARRDELVMYNNEIGESLRKL